MKVNVLYEAGSYNIQIEADTYRVEGDNYIFEEYYEEDKEVLTTIVPCSSVVRIQILSEYGEVQGLTEKH